MPRGIKRRHFLTTAGSAAGASSVVRNSLVQAVGAEPMPPTFDLGELRQSVQAVISGKRIGRPVFVRLTLHGPDKNAGVLRKLALMAEMTSSWIAQPVDRLHAVGRLESGQVCVAIQFKGGASALVSFAQGQSFGGGIDLMVLGNHGAIHHDSGAGTLWQSIPDFRDAEPDAVWSKAIERTLRSGKPTAPTAKDE